MNVDDNVFPKLVLVEGSAPSSPPATQFKLYVDSSDHLLKYKNSAGTVITLGAGVADQGTATYFDFTTGAAPSAPAAGKVRLYSKTGDHMYQRVSGGTETALDGAGGGGTTPTLLLDFTETTNLSVTGMSAATWTDVKANQNFTVVSATSLIEIAIRGFAIPNVAASNEIASRVVIDSAGTPINEALGGFFYSTNVGNYFAGSGSIFISGLTAAVHTIKIQAYSVTASNQFLCRTSSTPPEFLRMQIIEHL